MFKKLLALMGRTGTARHDTPKGSAVPEGAVMAAPPGLGPSKWHRKQLRHNEAWMRDFWRDKHSWPAGTADLEAAGHRPPEELDPHWYILKYLGRWSRAHYDIASQEMIDRAVADCLGISRTHAVLMRLGIHNDRPIWPDALIERNGPDPWATPEVHAFWRGLDDLPEEQLTRIGATAAACHDALRRNWRELHRIVTMHHPDEWMTIYRAAATPMHPCASQWVGDLHLAKARATFELMAARLIVGPLPCRNLALFGFNTPADLLEPVAGESGQPPEAGQ